MRLGLFTPIFNGLSLDALLVELKKYPQIEALEIGTGDGPGTAILIWMPCLRVRRRPGHIG